LEGKRKKLADRKKMAQNANSIYQLDMYVKNAVWRLFFIVLSLFSPILAQITMCFGG
jgi:hypothetical protein